MKLDLIIFSLFMITTLAAAISRKSNKNECHTYKKKADFLSPAERSFHGVLTQALADEFAIFSKTRVADLIEPATRNNWQSAFNKISSKHVDFLLCDKSTLKAVLAIELDDKSHIADKGKKATHF